MCAIAVGKSATDGERSIVNTYYVDGIAEDGATKNADSNDGITKLDALLATGENASVALGAILLNEMGIPAVSLTALLC